MPLSSNKNDWISFQKCLLIKPAELGIHNQLEPSLIEQSKCQMKTVGREQGARLGPSQTHLHHSFPGIALWGMASNKWQNQSRPSSLPRKRVKPATENKGLSFSCCVCSGRSLDGSKLQLSLPCHCDMSLRAVSGQPAWGKSTELLAHR